MLKKLSKEHNKAIGENSSTDSLQNLDKSMCIDFWQLWIGLFVRETNARGQFSQHVLTTPSDSTISPTTTRLLMCRIKGSVLYSKLAWIFLIQPTQILYRNLPYTKFKWCWEATRVVLSSERHQSCTRVLSHDFSSFFEITWPSTN